MLTHTFPSLPLQTRDPIPTACSGRGAFKKPRIAVASVTAASTASGVLVPNDEIFSINGVRALDSKTAATVLRSAATLNVLVIRIPPPPGGTGVIATLRRCTHRCSKHQRKLVVFNTLFALLLGGAAAHLHWKSEPLALSLSLAVNAVTSLTSAKGSVGATSLEWFLTGEVPSVLWPIITTGVRWMDYIDVVAPSVAGALMLFAVRLSRCSVGCLSCYPTLFSTCSVSTKLLDMLAWPLLLIFFLYSFGLLIAATFAAVDSSIFNSTWM